MICSVSFQLLTNKLPGDCVIPHILYERFSVLTSFACLRDERGNAIKRDF